METSELAEPQLTKEQAGVEVPTFEDVKSAAIQIMGKAVRTPMLESAALNAHTGGRVLIKPECLQRTGSFKFRGAYNRISRLGREAREGGVVAYSSGNHAQGVAAAAQLRGLPAMIVMPEDTPSIKVNNTRNYGAEVVFYDRQNEDREAIGQAIANERGAVLVPPYDDPFIIAGQGTAGFELAQDIAARGIKPESLLASASGGGLLAGISLAFSALLPETKLYSMEPEGFDDHKRSFASGVREKNELRGGSICDSLLSERPGELTFAITQKRVTGGLSVSEDEVRAAVRYAFETLKLVVEPGGAVALAAVLARKIECADRTTAIVLSGGNVDGGLFAEIVGG
ncbi:MAG: threonine ammonia-lyase [Hyphomicrobiales bacterium]